jgi:hypothetical protein
MLSLLHLNLLAVITQVASGSLPQWEGWRVVVAFLVSSGLIALTWWTTIKGKLPCKDNVGLFVGFFAAFAIVVGVFLIVVATGNWPTLLLIAGGCLGTGFLFGLLFGYPMSGPANKPKPANKGGSAPAAGSPPPAQAAPASDDGAGPQNLLRQSVDSLSKLIAGATLVQFNQIFEEFKKVALAISQTTAEGSGPQMSMAFGAGVTLYFVILGFLIGLLLPPLYHLNGPGAQETQS